MSKIKKLLRNILLSVVASVSTGCSTFIVYESYELAEAGSLNSVKGDVQVDVKFGDQSIFGSAGVIGLPVIPLYIRMIKEKELILRVYLNMNQEHDFSFLYRPCLFYGDGKKLCAAKLEIRSSASVQDDGSAYEDKRPRWNAIESFK